MNRINRTKILEVVSYLAEQFETNPIDILDCMCGVIISEEEYGQLINLPDLPTPNKDSFLDVYFEED